MKVCDKYLNSEGYPTKEALKIIKIWAIGSLEDCRDLLDFCRELWQWPDMAWEDEDGYNFSTGGWSGNESIIRALNKNKLFWVMAWHKSQAHGHFTFRVGARKPVPSMNWRVCQCLNGDLIVEDDRGDPVCSYINNPANAPIIAAAPKMLKVLEEVESCSEYWSEYDVPLCLHDNIKAAIAAAMGKGEIE